MTRTKRLMDIVLAVVMALILLPVILVVAVAILWRDGTPVFYVSERMKSRDAGFDLWKFRTMETAAHDSGVSGGDKTARITTTGRVLRRTRLDELPQLWNILRGDISFVGPRPPLRRYVEQFPEIYGPILAARPGVTGLATLAFHSTEEALLARCQTAEETEAVYVERCIPKKAALDLIYHKNRTICFDLWLMLATVIRRLPLRIKQK